MATIRRRMGHFDVTAGFRVESGETAYRQTGRWPETTVFGQGENHSRNRPKLGLAGGHSLEGFWPGVAV
jgi:hypothetical protein